MSNLATFPRGIRNNNPGNIRKTTTTWHGEVQVDYERVFEVFCTPADGIRAMMILFYNYQLKYQLHTVRELINRWAPPVENDTASYAFAVAKYLGVRQDDRISLFDAATMIKLAQAVTLHENGPPPAGRPAAWYELDVYRQAQQAADAAIRGRK